MNRRSFIKSVIAVLATPFIPAIKSKPRLTATEVIYWSEYMNGPLPLDIKSFEYKWMADCFAKHTIKMMEEKK